MQKSREESPSVENGEEKSWAVGGCFGGKPSGWGLTNEENAVYGNTGRPIERIEGAGGSRGIVLVP